MPQYEGLNLAPLPPGLTPSVGMYFDILSAKIKLHIRIKQKAFFTGRSIRMYAWLDSFIEEMCDYVSIDSLIKRLDPDQIAMFVKALSKHKNKSA